MPGPSPLLHPPAAQQITAFLAKYDPAIASLATHTRAWMRRQLPTATEIVYDNYNALVFGFGPSDRASEAVFSLALYPRWVNLFFMHGVDLPDPANVLRGSGKQVRSIRLTGPADLERPEVAHLITAALLAAAVPLPAGGRGATIIKSVSARQRSRR